MNSERIIGFGVLILGLLLFFVVIPIGVVEPGNIDHIALAPQFWPKIIAVIITAMGLLLTLRPSTQENQQKDVGDNHSWLDRLPGLAIVLGALFAFYFLIPTLGMVIPGMGLIFGLMLYAGERRLIIALLISVLIPLLLYFFFVYVANIPIPLGLFESLRG